MDDDTNRQTDRLCKMYRHPITSYQTSNYVSYKIMCISVDWFLSFLRWFHRQLKIQNLIIFGHLAAVLANINGHMVDGQQWWWWTLLIIEPVNTAFQNKTNAHYFIWNIIRCPVWSSGTYIYLAKSICPSISIIIHLWTLAKTAAKQPKIIWFWIIRWLGNHLIEMF